MRLFLLSYGVYAVVASVFTFVAYGFDKSRAQKNLSRIPERTLHGLGLAGGWPGAWLAQRIFRHKTRKLRFQLTFWLTVVVNTTAVVSVAYLLRQ